MHKSSQEFERMNSTQATVQQLKTPPHSIEAEYGVIGGLLLDCEKLYDVTDILSPCDFYHHLHKEYFSAMIALSDAEKKFDLLTISDYMSKQKREIEVNDIANLAEMIQRTPSSSNVVAYAKIIVSRAVDRRILAASQTIAGTVFEKNYTTEQRIEIAETAIMGVRTEMKSEVKDLNSVIYKTLGEMHEQESEECRELGRLVQLATVDELKGAFRLPVASSFSPVLCMRKSTDPVYEDPKDLIVIGYNDQGIEGNPNPIPVGIRLDELRKHVAIFGVSGSGKTTLNIHILYQLF